MNQIEIYVFQADQGDSFLVTIFDGNREINLLIDCGTYRTYQQYIRKKLLNMAQDGRVIDYLILTHLHSDHIGGAIPLLKENGSSGAPNIISVRHVLYNGFLGLQLQHYEKEICNDRDKRIYQGICGKGAAILSKCIPEKRITIQEELCLSKLLLDGRYNWNDGCGIMPNKIMTNDLEKINVEKHISIQLLSPGLNEIIAMNQEWEKYLKRIYKKIHVSDNLLIRSAYEAFQYILNNKEYDEIAQSIGQQNPDKEGIERLASDRGSYEHTHENSSSIAFLLQIDEKKLLFLGDSCISVCQRKLRELYGTNEMDMDFIKLSHHGSERNISEKFLKQFGSKNYLISAGTGSKRPSKKTLALLLMTHSDRNKKIFVTNRNKHILWMDQEKVHQFYDFEFVDIAGKSIKL